MSQTIVITKEDILDRVKLTSKIPEIVEQIVASKIIADAAFEAGIEVATEELQQAADQIRLVNKLNSAEDTWKWLETHGMTLDDFEKMVSTNLLSAKLAQHLFADKVERYFFERQLDYAGAVMYEILLDDEDLAIELFYAIKEGEISFYDVAHQHIKDTELRRKGGYKGTVHRKDLKPEISAAIFAATPSQILKPIITAQGAHLILVEEIVQPQLDATLRYKILSTLFADWLQQQIERYESVLIINDS
ncbi:MAG: peptidylprolyl isomerase [Hydrococcus sp. Prado102]|jgi:parvulin-like peptidyl-prolyl isomerase|nr:peptidylprolyl isomerase [Hydrococcus sp. Prado102]